MEYYLGIDTSCYTTSLAILDEKGNLLADKRKILTVKAGGRGLAQSEMVFQHTRNLPQLFEEALTLVDASAVLAAVGVSRSPRPLPDSYMPAFLVGEGYGRALSACLHVPLYSISHQENHVFAGMWSAGGPMKDEFLAMHVSGGTTEILHVKRKTDKLIVQLLGGSEDLHAGQFIDRVGVALGLPFPAGPHLEMLAADEHIEPVDIPFTVKGLQVSFSGPETHAQRLIERGVTASAVAAGVQLCIGRTLVKLAETAVAVTGVKDVLMVGGVAANRFIRQYLQTKLRSKRQVQLYYPDNRFSPDNATGAAFFALKHGTI